MPLRRHHAAAMVLRSCYARSSSSFTSYCHAREEERDRAERDVRRKKGFTLPTVPPSPREGRRRCARHRRPRRAVVEPTKQKSIAAIHATIAVREASMAVAIEFTSERRKLQVRVKGVTPPFLTAQPSPHLVVARVATAACHCGFSPLRRSLAYVAAFRARFTD
ncbi:uncharacterized protein LOC110277888 isoform X2 [Arachis duranensis]|uniref:Uncharacterized protein LOC110277888 isoform X2 n=1 Tax=Arachis duranensis TaxID=130453 RepID=A0A9C6TAI9_ARADU|nr:uncharacterized protein LOC110277888 isoform X2 [Arachis duranensis]